MLQFRTRKFLLFNLLLALAVSFNCALAQTGEGVSAGLPVIVGGKELLVVHGDAGGRNAERRRSDLTAEINLLVDNPAFKPSALTVNSDSSAIIYGDKVIVAVTQNDATSAGLTQADLAQKWLGSLRTSIESERYKRNLSDAIDQVKFGTVKSNILYILANPLSLRIGISVLGLIVLIIVTYSIRRSIPRYFHESYKRYTVSKIAEFSSYFLGLVYLSIVFSDTLGSLAVILGAATAGIALALKELIVSMAGWLAITFGDTYRVGDRVQIAGIKGDVIDVGLVRTTLMELGEWVQGDLYTGRIVRVANGSIFAGPMYNYSKDLPFLWDEVVIKITNESDVEQARSIIQGVVDDVVGDYVNEAKLGWERLKEKYLVEDEKIEPMVTMIVNSDSKFEFTARYPVDFRQRRTVKDEVFSAVVSGFNKTEGAVKLV